MKRKARDLGQDPITGEKIHDWKWINERVTETSRQTDIEFAEFAAKVRAEYASTPNISALTILKRLLGK